MDYMRGAPLRIYTNLLKHPGGFSLILSQEYVSMKYENISFQQIY